MGLPVQSKKYEFGVTYERNADGSDKTGGSCMNPKLRVLVVASDVLEKAKRAKINPDRDVAGGLSKSHVKFIKRSWSNIRKLADLCDDSGRVGWIV